MLFIIWFCSSDLEKNIWELEFIEQKTGKNPDFFKYLKVKLQFCRRHQPLGKEAI